MREHNLQRDELQPPPVHVDEKRSPKQFTIDQFTWLDQIAADTGLTSSAFKVAYAISRYINRETGEAWPSFETISRKIAMSPATVVAMVRKLVDAGYLQKEPGRAGRGYSNHYRMMKPWLAKPSQPQLAKDQPADVSQCGEVSKVQPAKTSGSAAENIRSEEIKGQPADMNPLKNPLSNPQEAALHAAVSVDRENVTSVTLLSSDDKATRAFSALLREYPEQPSAGDINLCRDLLNEHLDAGVEVQEILKGARVLAFGYEGEEQVKPLVYFLQIKGWKNDNFDLMWVAEPHPGSMHAA
jgi:hypothetical protein